jgi:hypothetical protein
MRLLDGDPRWTHRRRLVYGTVALAWLMIVVAMLDVTDRQVSSQLVVGAVSLLSIVLSAYTAFGTLDDRWQKRADHEPSDFDSPDRGPYGDGLAG